MNATTTKTGDLTNRPKIRLAKTLIGYDVLINDRRAGWVERVEDYSWTAHATALVLNARTGRVVYTGAATRKEAVAEIVMQATHSVTFNPEGA